MYKLLIYILHLGVKNCFSSIRKPKVYTLHNAQQSQDYHSLFTRKGAPFGAPHPILKTIRKLLFLLTMLLVVDAKILYMQKICDR